MLAGTESDVILKSARSMLLKENGWKNPLGEGKAAENIVRAMAMEKDIVRAALK